MLDEFCEMTGYHRKYSMALLGRPVDEVAADCPRRRRGASYGPAVSRALEHIWESAGYPWSARFKAMLPQWLPWARRRLRGLTPDVEQALLKISPRQIDRLLANKKRRNKKRLYGHTKPGKLLKSQIPIRTDNWDVTSPGYLEIDLVVHCGPSASGEFVCSFNLTDICTGWTETRAIMGKGETGVVAALEEVRLELPFDLVAIDSDNGSEYINKVVAKLLNGLLIKQTKSRPRHSNDNPLAETKNGAIIRKHIGYSYIAKKHAGLVNTFYQNTFNDYLNYHRPCGFAEITVNAKGKELKKYPPENYLTPYEKFKSLPNAEQYLKPKVTFKDLDRLANATSDIEYAKFMQTEKFKMFKIIQSNP